MMMVMTVKLTHRFSVLVAAAGIPDYRTPGTGLFDLMEKTGKVKDAQDLFSLEHFMVSNALVASLKPACTKRQAISFNLYKVNLYTQCYKYVKIPKLSKIVIFSTTKRCHDVIA